MDPGNTITGVYTYFDPNGDPEGTSLYQWYIALEPDGSDKVAITGATSITYDVATDDEGKYLVFEVTPVSTIWPDTGLQVSVVSYQVGTAGLGKITLDEVTIFPNPVQNNLYFENAGNLTVVNVHNILGQEVESLEKLHSDQFTVSTSNWNPGIYFVVIVSKDNSSRTFKIIKN